MTYAAITRVGSGKFGSRFAMTEASYRRVGRAQLGARRVQMRWGTALRRVGLVIQELG